MKKFAAILLPVVLIGSLVAGMLVTAAPCADEFVDGGDPLNVNARISVGGHQDTQVTASQTVRMRSTPQGHADDSHANVIAYIPGGAVGTISGDIVSAWTRGVPCNSTSGRWVRVTFPGHGTGYVFSDFLRIDGARINHLWGGQ